MTERDEMVALADFLDCMARSMLGDGSVPALDEMFKPRATKLKQAADALRSASRAGPDVAVKPLEWLSKIGVSDYFYTDTGIGSYRVWMSSAPLEWFWRRDDLPYQGPFNTELDVKAAAQADFEQRIRSAITATVGTAEPGYVASTVKTLLNQVASVICEETCGLTSECKSREAAKALYKKGLLAALPAPATASAGEEVTAHTLVRIIEPSASGYTREFQAAECVAEKLLSTYKITKRSAT